MVAPTWITTDDSTVAAIRSAEKHSVNVRLLDIDVARVVDAPTNARASKRAGAPLTPEIARIRRSRRVGWVLPKRPCVPYRRENEVQRRKHHERSHADPQQGRVACDPCDHKP